jgi:hypothetical protein
MTPTDWILIVLGIPGLYGITRTVQLLDEINRRITVLQAEFDARKRI